MITTSSAIVQSKSKSQVTAANGTEIVTRSRASLKEGTQKLGVTHSFLLYPRLQWDGLRSRFPKYGDMITISSRPLRFLAPHARSELGGP